MRGLIRDTQELCAENRNKINTVIIGPNPILCESLARYLNKTQFKVIARTKSIAEMMSAVVPRDHSVLVIVDSSDSPEDFCGEIQRLSQVFPLARIAILATKCTSAQVTMALKAGAHGYLASITTCNDFIKSLELITNGQTIFPSECFPGEDAEAMPPVSRLKNGTPAIPADATAPEDLPKFSERELHVLRCLVEGSSNKVIARTCDISEGTVKVHVKAILRKLNVRNRTQAAMWAVNHRWIVWPAEPVPDYFGILDDGLSGASGARSSPLLNSTQRPACHPTQDGGLSVSLNLVPKPRWKVHSG